MTTNSSVDCILSAPLLSDLSCAFAEVREAIDTLRFDFESLGIERISLLSECNTKVQVFAAEGATLWLV
jgi:hypothetical protein